MSWFGTGTPAPAPEPAPATAAAPAPVTNPAPAQGLLSAPNKGVFSSVASVLLRPKFSKYDIFQKITKATRVGPKNIKSKKTLKDRNGISFINEGKKGEQLLPNTDEFNIAIPTGSTGIVMRVKAPDSLLFGNRGSNTSYSNADLYKEASTGNIYIAFNDIQKLGYDNIDWNDLMEIHIGGNPKTFLSRDDKLVELYKLDLQWSMFGGKKRRTKKTKRSKKSKKARKTARK
jgi:hypothetical protein